MARAPEVLKALLLGRPKETGRLLHERLSKRVGLAVFASDNLSSSAYATEEMLLVLVAGGAVSLRYSVPIAVVLVCVVGIIAFSYRQTIHAYPNGGGAYIVAHTNLGRYPGLVAASALLIDYVLTVAVSVSAGVGAIVSFAPGLHSRQVVLALGVIWFITLMNLRGVRESGTLFAIPTYAFLVLVGGTVLIGLFRVVTGDVTPVQAGYPPATTEVSLFLLMTALARGSAAVTGIEAISNGIPAFRDPSPRNAARTLVIMAFLLAFLFLGISVVARSFHIFEATETRTVVGRVAEVIWGEGIIFVAVLSATALILFLAANTSYADFPRLSAVLARDRFWPRQFMNRGDRLGFSNGILGLAVFASILVVIFEASVTRLINLYVIGVFTALTLNQAGMIRHWIRNRRREPRWHVFAALNSVGATTTTTVLIIVLLTRFLHGGWMVVIAIPALVLLMNRISSHYDEVRLQLRDPNRAPRRGRANHVILLVGGPSAEEARAFFYADLIRIDDFHAVHVAERKDPKGLEAKWVRQIGLLPTSPALEIVSPTGTLPATIRRYVDRMRSRIASDDFITVIVSERVKENALFSLGTTTGLRVKTSLLFAPGVVVTDVPYLESLHQQSLHLGRRQSHVVVVLVAAAHNATLHALEYAKTLAADEVHAVHVALDPEMADHHCREWDWLETGYELRVIDAPYRRLGQTLRDYVQPIVRDRDAVVTVVLAEFLVRRRWQHLLHNQNALDVKLTLLSEPDVVVTSVPYRLVK